MTTRSTTGFPSSMPHVGNSATALVWPLALDLPVNHGSELVEQAEGDGVGDYGGALLSQLLDVAPQIELLDARPQCIGHRSGRQSALGRFRDEFLLF